MHRTTIYLDRDLDLRLRAEARRRRQPVAELIREALRDAFMAEPRPASRHAGAFSSGRGDIASRVDETLDETGFGHPRCRLATTDRRHFPALAADVPLELLP